MTALNVAYGTNLTLFSDQEALNMAGLGTAYTGETFSTTMNYPSFIHFNTVPEPSSILLGLMAFIGGAILALGKPGARRRR